MKPRGERLEDLAPGEMRVFRCDEHHIHYELRDERGELAKGELLDPSEPGNLARAAGLIDAGESVRPGVFPIKRLVRFTSRGPAQVASLSYHEGWDRLFAPAGAAGRAS